MSSKTPEAFRRVTSLRAFDSGDATTILGRDGAAREFRGESALLIREMLRALRSPQTAEQVLAGLDKVASGAADAHSVVEEALRLLQEAGCITRVDSTPPPARRGTPGRLVLGISGAVAAAHSPGLLERFLARGFEVRVALTQAAGKFVRASALRALSHQAVRSSLWSLEPGVPAPHIAWAEWAEVVLVAPATATTLSRVARGDCSDLVSAVALSTRAPVLLAPSMNAAMLDAGPIARNVRQLTDDGFFVLYPSFGIEVAEAPEGRRPRYGSWAAPEDIVAVTEHVWLRARQRAAGALNASAVAAVWEEEYRRTPPGELPFHTDALDSDLAEELERVPRPAALWEIGAGLGSAARAAAKLGFTVTATDISPKAVELATARSNGEEARFEVDDVRDSRVSGPFEVVLDRGCFHTLDADGARHYAAAVQSRTRPGARLILKLHREDEPRELRTVRYRASDLQSLFAPAFELIRWTQSSLPGALEPPARAWLAVFERR
jgi:3-polyprenyl-4-hydroxybenzoate decarboxylase